MHGLSDVTLLLLIAHLLGDFQLCCDEENGKKWKASQTFRHVLTHLVLLLPVSAWLHIRGHSPAGWVLAFVLAGAHLLTERMSTTRAFFGYENRTKIIYAMKQCIHVGLVMVLSEGVFYSDTHGIHIPFSTQHLRWILLFVLITKPANVFFHIFFSKYRLVPSPAEPTHIRYAVETEPGAGALIGSLERILSAVFLTVGQFGAIGLIYTAKSVARFKQIEENRRFAEYYLIGTLYSILFVVISYYLVIVGVI